jgi:hypothetical protein
MLARLISISVGPKRMSSKINFLLVMESDCPTTTKYQQGVV